MGGSAVFGNFFPFSNKGSPRSVSLDLAAMELLITLPAKCELREIIRFLNAKAIKPIKIHRQLIEVYNL